MAELKSKSDKTRAQIIEGALRALAQTGVIGTTTRKIAAEAGVQLATLHYQFESKSALLVAVLEALIEEMTFSLRKQVRPGSSLDDGIAQLLSGAWRAVMQTRTIQLVHYELTLYALREGPQSLAEQQYDAYVRLYRDYLSGITDENHRMTPAAYTALARFMVAGIDGLILQELAKPNAARSRRGVDALITAAQAHARDLLTTGA